MKSTWRSRIDALKNRLVLTPEEKRVLGFVLVALAAGIAMQHCRDVSSAPAVSVDPKHPWRKHLISPASPTPPQIQKRPRTKKQKPTPSPSATVTMSILSDSRFGGGMKASPKKLCVS